MIIYCSSFPDIDMSFLKDNGMGIEIIQYANPVFLDGFDNNHAKTAQYMHGAMGASMHGAFYDLVYTSHDPLICEVARKRFVQSIKAAAFHSIERIVFHSTYRNFHHGGSNAAMDDFLKKSIEFWQGFEQNIPDGMTVYLENCEDEDPELFVRILEGINSPKIRCCFDMAHAFCNSSISMDRWIDTLGRWIEHVHLSDNDGSSDQHLPLGAGKAPLAGGIRKIIEQSGEDTVFVLECDASKSVLWLKEQGFMSRS